MSYCLHWKMVRQGVFVVVPFKFFSFTVTALWLMSVGAQHDSTCEPVTVHQQARAQTFLVTNTRHTDTDTFSFAKIQIYMDILLWTAFPSILGCFFTCQCAFPPKIGSHQINLLTQLWQIIPVSLFSGCPSLSLFLKGGGARFSTRWSGPGSCKWRLWRCQQYIVDLLLILCWCNLYPGIRRRIVLQGYNAWLY